MFISFWKTYAQLIKTEGVLVSGYLTSAKDKKWRGSVSKYMRLYRFTETAFSR